MNIFRVSFHKLWQCSCEYLLIRLFVFRLESEAHRTFTCPCTHAFSCTYSWIYYATYPLLVKHIASFLQPQRKYACRLFYTRCQSAEGEWEASYSVSCHRALRVPKLTAPTTNCTLLWCYLKVRLKRCARTPYAVLKTCSCLSHPWN